MLQQQATHHDGAGAHGRDAGRRGGQLGRAVVPAHRAPGLGGIVGHQGQAAALEHRILDERHVEDEGGRVDDGSRIQVGQVE